jgi:ABC-type uncharacterized transport system involved in gliding motility auxiliary subunit
LTRGASKSVYFVIGHGEVDPQDRGEQGFGAFAAALSDENITVQTLQLASASEVPADAAAVIVSKGTAPYFATEKDVLKRYVDGGGKLLILADTRTSSDIKELAGYYGFKLGDDVIIDQQNRLLTGPSYGVQPLISSYAVDHPATVGLSERTLSIMNIATAVQYPDQSAAGEGGKQADQPKYQILASTGATSWAESDLASIFDSGEPQVSFDQGADRQGPIPVVVAYEKELADQSSPDGESMPENRKVARVVVAGDQDWLTTQLIASGSNRRLALGLVSWLTGEAASLEIPTRAIRPSFAPIPKDTFLMMLVGSFVLPELLLLMGLVVWWNRRQVVA